MNSSRKLQLALQDAAIAIPTAEPRKRKVWEMSERAGTGYYSDYNSPLATPCIQLVADLRALGLEELAKRAIDGDFDATKEESDEWAQSEAGRATIREAGMDHLL